MKLQVSITEGAPEFIIEAFRSQDFARLFHLAIIRMIFDIKQTEKRPAEFCVQLPTSLVKIGNSIGVELRLTGVSRNGRKAKQFHNALETVHSFTKDMIQRFLTNHNDKTKIQLFTTLELDGDVETPPGSGAYSNVLEHPAEWVTMAPTEKDPGI